MQELSTFISQHPALFSAVAVVLALVMLTEFIRARRNVFNINPTQVTQLMNRENALVIDIRTNDAFKQGHIIDAQLMPAADVTKNSKKLEKFKSRPIIVVAAAGADSQKIAALLIKHGYNAYSLAGGMRAWMEAQMPLVKE